MTSIWAVRRSASDHKVSGLSAGVARHWNVDPVLIRVGFVVLAFAGGIGAILYVAGWLMVPLDGRERSQLDDLVPQTRRWSQELRVAIVALICLLCLAASSWVVPFGLAAAAVLAAVWYFGYYKHRSPRPEHNDHDTSGPEEAQPEEPVFFDYPGPSTPFTEAARSWQARIVAEQQARQDTQPATPPAPAAASGATADPLADSDRAAFLSTPDPVGLYESPASHDLEACAPDQERLERRRSARKLGLLTVITIGLALAGLGVASSMGAGITLSSYLAAVLLIIGVALLAGTKYGRPPGATLAAVLVALAMVASLTVARPAIVGRSLGVHSIDYSAAKTMPSSDHLDLGRLTVNLTDLEPPKHTAHNHSTHYRASVDAGQLTLVLPKNVPAKIRASVGEGQLSMPGTSKRSGSDVSAVTRTGSLGKGSATTRKHSDQKQKLTIHLHVDQGVLEVRK